MICMTGSHIWIQTSGGMSPSELPPGARCDCGRFTRDSLDAFMAERDALAAQVAELTAERDEIRQIDGFADGTIIESIRFWMAELHHWEKQIPSMRELKDNTQIRAALAASEAQVAALVEAGERLYDELQDAAFGYEGVHWKVQRDAPEALEAWRALAPTPAPMSEEGAEG